MDYLNVLEISKLWGISERSVRAYCAQNRVEGAFLKGKIWYIPSDAKKPTRINNSIKDTNYLLERLRAEKEAGIKGGIYHKIQLELTYNSNHIEGNTLTHEQTRYIYETNTIGLTDGNIKVDDIVETVNHFRCIDIVIENANRRISEEYIKKMHSTLKAGTVDSRKKWFAVGEYKKLPNEVVGNETTPPNMVSNEISKLIREYNIKKNHSLEEIIEFHYKFESIHPFQDGNGRVGRLIMFGECLKNNIVPFIITDELKLFYYRGLSNWTTQKGYLMDTCLLAQDNFKEYLEYFKILFN